MVVNYGALHMPVQVLSKDDGVCKIYIYIYIRPNNLHDELVLRIQIYLLGR